MHCVTERYNTILTGRSGTGLNVFDVSYTSRDDFGLDAIRAAFENVTLSSKQLSERFAQLNAELARLEALSGHSEYVIHEEADIFD